MGRKEEKFLKENRRKVKSFTVFMPSPPLFAQGPRGTKLDKIITNRP